MIPILYIQPYASQVGGVDTVLLELIAGLDKSRFRPFVVLPGPSPYVEKYKDIGAEVRFAPVAVFGKPRGWSYYFVNLAKLFASMRALRAIVRKEKIALIHSHKMEAMGGNLLGKPRRFGGIGHGAHGVDEPRLEPRRPILQPVVARLGDIGRGRDRHESVGPRPLHRRSQAADERGEA